MDYDKRTNPGLNAIKPYFPGRPLQELRREGVKKNLVKMASNENPLGISPAGRRSILKALRSAYQYPESSCPVLREALARRLRLKPENLIVGNGADGVIWYLGMSILDEGDEAVIPAATFPLYETIVRAMRAKVVSSPMDGYRINLNDVLSRVNENTKVVWLCNPNNPTGTLFPKDHFWRFYERIPESVLVVYDEVYRDFAPTELLPETVAAIREGKGGNLFLLRSFSKIFGLAGLRVGYGIGDPRLISMMYRARPPFDVSVLAQQAAVGALAGRRFVEKTLTLNREGKEFIYSHLRRLGLRFAPSETNFILLDTGMESTAACRELERRGIVARPADKYGYPGHIRVTVGLMKHNRRFIQALEELLASREICRQKE